MKLIRTLTLAAALVAAAFAEPVYFSQHGKTFHKSDKCMSLARSSHVYTADREDALKHGLHQCSICFRAKKAGSAAGASSWATEARKESKP